MPRELSEPVVGSEISPEFRRGSESRTYRLTAIDALRGLAVVIMALDHVRDSFMAGAAPDPATDPDIGAALFLTRWITHMCAPVFVFLAGTSAGLMAARKSPSALGRFLLKRGVWLILIEWFVISNARSFAPLGIPQLGGLIFCRDAGAASPSGTRRRRCRPTCERSGPARSEVELRAELEQPPAHDLRGQEPGSAVEHVHSGHCCLIKQIVDVKLRLETRPAQAEELRESEVDLIDAVIELRVRLDQLHLRNGVAGGRVTTSRSEQMCVDSEVGGGWVTIMVLPRVRMPFRFRNLPAGFVGPPRGIACSCCFQ